MSTKQRQHYVPQSFLKHFVNENGILFSVRKGTSPLVVNPVTPANVFVKKNLYKPDGKLTSIKTDIEAKFSDLESEFSPLQKRLLETVREGRVPRMHRNEKVTFSKFVLTQVRRIPDKTSADRCLAREIVKRHIEQVNRAFDSYETPYTSPEAVEEYVDIVQMSAMIEPTPEIIQKMSQGEPCYMRIAVPRCSFVVGSNPVVQNLPFAAAAESDEVKDLFLAISHDVGVIISGSINSPIQKNIYQKSSVRELNELVRDQSTIIAGCSRELIRSLCKKWK